MLGYVKHMLGHCHVGLGCFVHTIMSIYRFIRIGKDRDKQRYSIEIKTYLNLQIRLIFLEYQ